jgi:hypothetical protein
MIGFLLMGVVVVAILYVLFAKTYPALAFRYTGSGERKGKAEYQRIKREHPDAPEARKSEAEFVENYIMNGPSPWKWVALVFLLALVGIPVSCTIGAVSFMN